MYISRQNIATLVTALSGYLPYGVKFHYFSEFADGEDPEFDNTMCTLDTTDEQILDEDHENWIPIANILPYLRPMEDISDEEKEYITHLAELPCVAQTCMTKVDYFNSHYIDWRGLIPKKLAIKAPEGMYNNRF